MKLIEQDNEGSVYSNEAYSIASLVPKHSMENVN